MIPVEQVNPDAANALMQYLLREIRRAESERQPLEQRWMEYQRMYKAEPEFEFKEFPFLGASNLVITVIATDVDTTFSRLMGLLFAPDNLWSTRPTRPDMIEFAARLQEFLQVVQERELNAYNAVADFLLDMCKLGTGILKQRYKRETKQVYEFRETPQGVYEAQRKVTLHDHPILEHVSLWDFLIPSLAIDIQSAPWCQERLFLTYGQYLNRVRDGIYTGHDRIAYWMANSKGSQILQNLMRLDRFEAGIGDLLDVRECWLDFDIRGAGEPQAIVATIHMPSMTFLRIDWNPFFNQEKPYSYARYMRQEKRFYGIGLAEMQFHYQHEITAMHNQRIDSGTIANATMFKGKKGSVRQDEEVFPGRWFLLDNMDDVQVLNMGSGKYDSTIQNENATLSYSKQRSGVNDYITGASTPAIGYATLGTNLQQLEQVTQRFDQTLREVRRALAESGTRLVELYQQFNQGGKEYIYLGQEDGEILHQFLQFPIELVRMGVGIDVTATSAALNKDTQIRSNTLIMQMLNQYYQQSIQAMQIALNPQLPPPMREMASLMIGSTTTMMRRILDTQGLQDADMMLPRAEQIAQLTQMGQMQTQGMMPPRMSGQVQTRAGGGPLDPGATTLVGERGPELITPGFGGQQQVIPLNGMMFAGGSSTFDEGGYNRQHPDQAAALQQALQEAAQQPTQYLAGGGDVGSMGGGLPPLTSDVIGTPNNFLMPLSFNHIPMPSGRRMLAQHEPNVAFRNRLNNQWLF